jgi:peptidyl-prolyl cis-trans isomerase SurA
MHRLIRSIRPTNGLPTNGRATNGLPAPGSALRPVLGLAAVLLAAAAPAPAPATNGKTPAPAAAKAPLLDRLSPSQAAAIVATVNGQAITLADVDNRRRLLAASVGLPLTPDILDRLTAPIERELIDETLREQEMRRRHIAIPEAAVEQAVATIEQRNNLPHGALLQRLAAAGIAPSTLLNQLRAQLGWGQAVRQALGSRAEVTDADIADREAALRAEAGQTEYNVGEIFLPASGAQQQKEASGVADLIIQQLREGAPFPLIAVQFSQSQSALAGGNLGWVQANQLDPEVLKVVHEMPPGAISNPIEVPGGEIIVTLYGTRVIGAPPAPPAQPASAGAAPGQPASGQAASGQQAGQQAGQPSGPGTGPAPAPDSKRAIEEAILGERFELASRQMIRDLERRALIDRRS